MCLEDLIQLAASKVINEYCKSFLEESQGLPLVKNLSTANIVDRIKVRQRNFQSIIGDSFNEAFGDVYNKANLYQTVVFVNGLSVPLQEEGKEPYYVFPIDGYEYLYCEQIRDTNRDYHTTFGELFELLGEDKNRTKILLKDLMRNTYTNISLIEAINSRCEILLFNIPYFYAVKVSKVTNYQQLIA